MASIIEFETSRLRMRQWRESDRAPFAAMNADPAVMEFFASPPSPAAGDASIDAWQAQFAAQGWSNSRRASRWVGAWPASSGAEASPPRPHALRYASPSNGCRFRRSYPSRRLEI